MKYIGHRFITQYRAPQKRRSLFRRLCVLLLILAALWAILCEWALSSVTQNLCEEAVHSYVLSRMNRAVAEVLSDSDKEFLKITEQNGAITSLQMNQSAMNSVKSQLTETLEKSVSRTATVSIPIGSLCGARFLNGRGPRVPLRLHLESAVTVSFRSELTSAGVNQSCHRVLLQVHVSTSSQSKEFPVVTEAKTETVLSETVIVGDVPGVVWSSTT